VLEARGLHLFRAADGVQVPILRDVTLSVAKGELCTVMGPSGSGKSTLLHLLAGLDRPTAGQVLVDGEDLGAGDEERRAAVRRRKVGIVFQFFHLLPDLTVEENVSLPLRILGVDPRKHRDRIDELLRLLRLTELRARAPRRLSGGEMQRTSIARALVTQPPLLLADEPTGNLSSKDGETIVQTLRDVADRFGTTVLLVTHNPRDAAAGDRVLFLHDGEMNPDHALTGGNFRAADVFRRLEELGI